MQAWPLSLARSHHKPCSATAMTNQVLERIRDHFLNPRNQEEIPDPDLVIEMGCIADGDAVKLMIKFDESQRIKEAKFQSFGACESIAAFSILTEMLIGRSAQEAAAITEKDFLDYVFGSSDIPMFETARAVELLRQGCWKKWKADTADLSNNEIRAI